MELIPVGALRRKGTLGHAFKKIRYRLMSKDYHRERDPLLLRYYAEQVGEALKEIDCDAVFSPGTIPLSFLETEKPTVFWTDSTFAGLVGYYPEFSNLCEETIRNGNEVEQSALSRCTLALYASEWAAEGAVSNYDVDSKKVKVVPFGAWYRDDWDEGRVAELAEKKDLSVCRLLFVGVDWLRKGGDVAVAVAQDLNEQGIKTELDVVGCEDPGGLPDFVKVHGFISRKTEEGKQKLEELFSSATFFILPTQAECFGLVFAEASSYGLPSLAVKTGGVPTAIREGVNGWTFPADVQSAYYTSLIKDVLSSKERYVGLARSCFREYAERLNFKAAGERIRSLMEEHC